MDSKNDVTGNSASSHCYPAVGSWWTLKRHHGVRWRVVKVSEGAVYARRNDSPFFVDETSMFVEHWNKVAAYETDTDGDGDCHLCHRKGSCLYVTQEAG